MSDQTLKYLVRRVVTECAAQWTEYSEPVSLNALGSLINAQLIKALGAGWNAGRLTEWMEGKQLVQIIRSRAGKRWVILWDVWVALSDDERIALRAKCEILTDPLTERMHCLRSQRLAKSSTPDSNS